MNFLQLRVSWAPVFIASYQAVVCPGQPLRPFLACLQACFAEQRMVPPHPQTNEELPTPLTAGCQCFSLTCRNSVSDITDALFFLVLKNCFLKNLAYPCLHEPFRKEL